MLVKNYKSKKNRKYKRTNRFFHHIFMDTVEMRHFLSSSVNESQSKLMKVHRKSRINVICWCLPRENVVIGKFSLCHKKAIFVLWTDSAKAYHTYNARENQLDATWVNSQAATAKNDSSTLTLASNADALWARHARNA